jgi:hypothetical protein
MDAQRFTPNISIGFGWHNPAISFRVVGYFLQLAGWYQQHPVHRHVVNVGAIVINGSVVITALAALLTVYLAKTTLDEARTARKETEADRVASEADRRQARADRERDRQQAKRDSLRSRLVHVSELVETIAVSLIDDMTHPPNYGKRWEIPRNQLRIALAGLTQELPNCASLATSTTAPQADLAVSTSRTELTEAIDRIIASDASVS